MAEPFFMHECRGTESRQEIVGNEGRTWILCDTCKQWWCAAIVNMGAIRKPKSTSTMKRSEGDTQNGRKET